MMGRHEGQEVFESLFVRTVQQCVSAGLVDRSKLHLDGSLINAHAISCFPFCNTLIFLVLRRWQQKFSLGGT